MLVSENVYDSSIGMTIFNSMECFAFY